MSRLKESYGHLHPVTQVITEMTDFFVSLGFTVAQGPEVEEEWYNFDALNTPPDHPSRDMQDTFWLEPIKDRRLLRTHTSPVQIRFMEKEKPPIRVIAPGRVYRNESIDATHEAQFHQVEGLMVDEVVSLAHLKGVLEKLCRALFGTETEIRLRPSYFPFVEPGVEVDVSCFKCRKKEGVSGCSICKSSGWIEILGAGLVHPEVLRSVNLDVDRWQGLAFGVSPERVAMMKYGIDDIRLFYNSDLRVLGQF